LLNRSKIAYISFDTVPAPKGAATHIKAFSQVLATAFGEIELVTVSPTSEIINPPPIYPQVTQIMLPALGNNLINRVLYFRHLLRKWLEKKRFQVIQVRSIYEGFVIAVNKEKYCDRLIFEVNGLPSIELKYRYPDVIEDRELLHKLYSQEQICLEASDLIVTPSSITAKYLQSRGVPINKIRVIPNGVDLDIFSYRLKRTVNTSLQIIYFGTFSPWQGINLAIEALGLVNRDFPAHLTVIGQGRDSQAKALKHLGRKLEVTDRLTLLDPLPQGELVEYIHQSDLILAPLTANDRNLIQGCCPLKILEGMATGIPIIASDLPVVRELGTDEVDFLLVKSGSAKSIKDAIFRVHYHPELTQQIVINARKRIEEHYTWQKSGQALIAAYGELGINRSMTV
jgi:glycosyltransferase involved in cell wall biosynthesis